MDVEFEEPATAPRANPEEKVSRMSRFLISLGLAKDPGSARLLLIAFSLACITLAIALPFIFG